MIKVNGDQGYFRNANAALAHIEQRFSIKVNADNRLLCKCPDCSKEFSVPDEGLVKDNATLRAENEKLKRRVDDLHRAGNEMMIVANGNAKFYDLAKQLEDKNTKLRKALEEYSNKRSWRTRQGADCYWVGPCPDGHSFATKALEEE